jgi:hypothetical protein
MNSTCCRWLSGGHETVKWAKTCGGLGRRVLGHRRWRALSIPRARARQLLVLLLILQLPLSLAACAPGALGGPRYLPANADIDPYANMRRKTEELYQAGLGQERRHEWRQALQSYEQAHLWDPDNRADIADALDHARQEARALALAAPTPTATLQPVPPKGGMAVPTATGALGPTSGARPAGPAPTAVPTTPAVAQAGYRTFRSTVYPYTISYPATWTVKGDTSGNAQEHVDLFRMPSGTAEAFVMVQAQQLRFDVTLDQYLTLVENQLVTDAGASVLDVQSRKVGGTFSYVLSYRLQSNGAYLAVRHALFRDGNLGWSVVLIATPGTTPDLLKVFDAMLESFALQNDPARIQ